MNREEWRNVGYTVLYVGLVYLVILGPDWKAYLGALLISGVFVTMGIVLPGVLLRYREAALERTQRHRVASTFLRFTFLWYRTLRAVTFCLVLLILPAMVAAIRFNLF